MGHVSPSPHELDRDTLDEKLATAMERRNYEAEHHIVGALIARERDAIPPFQVGNRIELAPDAPSSLSPLFVDGRKIIRDDGSRVVAALFFEFHRGAWKWTVKLDDRPDAPRYDASRFQLVGARAVVLA